MEIEVLAGAEGGPPLQVTTLHTLIEGFQGIERCESSRRILSSGEVVPVEKRVPLAYSTVGDPPVPTRVETSNHLVEDGFDVVAWTNTIEGVPPSASIASILARATGGLEPVDSESPWWFNTEEARMYRAAREGGLGGSDSSAARGRGWGAIASQPWRALAFAAGLLAVVSILVVRFRRRAA